MIYRIGAALARGFFGRELWRDENFDMLGAKVPGANNLPTPVTPPGCGIPYAGFLANGITEYPGHKEYNHEAVTGFGKARIRPHAHFACTTTGAGDVKLFCEVRITAGDAVQLETLSVVVAASGVAYTQEQKVELGEIVLAEGLADIGAQIGFRFYRNGDDAQDTYAGTVIMSTAGWHYPLNSAGSRGIFAK